MTLIDWFDALPWYERLIFGLVGGWLAFTWGTAPYHLFTRLDRIVTALERIANKK